MILLLSLLSTSQAEDVDITIIQSNFSAGGIIGISGLDKGKYGYLRYGITSYLIRDPLIYFEDNIDQGAIIARRLVNQVGAEFDFSPGFGVHASIPVALQWSSEIPSMTRNGFGIGDIKLGAYGKLWQRRDLGIGAKVDLFIPSATNNAWLGENSPRSSFMGNLVYSWDQFEFFGQPGLHFRSPVNTDMDFVIDSELFYDIGARWNIWNDRYALVTSYHSRNGLNNIFRGGAENTSEITTSVQQWRNNSLWQMGFSKGVTDGYGSSEFQVFIGYTMHRRPKKELDEIIYFPPPKDEPVVIEEPPVEEITNWEEEELAKVEADQIIIRDAIQFEVGTDNILITSEPTLDFVASRINADVQIGHIVIEGHASAEGSHDYNYDLSNLRARAIFKALVKAGVHPDRLSHRGYGESLPQNTGDSEEALAKNRRVEFHIIRQDAPDTVLNLRELQSAPWAEILLELITPMPQKPKTESSTEEEYEGELFEEPTENNLEPETLIQDQGEEQ
jgi:outer membrane protein OmpA-like peptidoglycan-associated protein